MPARFDPRLGAPEQRQALHPGSDRGLVVAGAPIPARDGLEERRPAPGIELSDRPSASRR